MVFWSLLGMGSKALPNFSWLRSRVDRFRGPHCAYCGLYTLRAVQAACLESRVKPLVSILAFCLSEFRATSTVARIHYEDIFAEPGEAH